MYREYLLEYNSPSYFALNSTNIKWKLTVRTVWFWGLFTMIRKKEYEVQNHEDSGSYFKNWDNLIKKQLPIFKVL